MRTRDNVWQGSFGYWQNLFIHEHVLEIGYTAWNGFLTLGRGMVVCDVIIPENQSVNWSLDVIEYVLGFLDEPETIAYLQKLELSPEIRVSLCHIVATYDPSQAIVILLTGNGQVDINLLQQLAFPPADCYNQVRQRWDEFQPCLINSSRCDE